jgi:hypothetical protein
VEVAGRDASNPDASAKAGMHASARMKATLKKPTQQQTALFVIYFHLILAFDHKLRVRDLWSCSLPKMQGFGSALIYCGSGYGSGSSIFSNCGSRFRIRIPDPDPGFDDLKFKKIYNWNFNFYFLDQKLPFTYP